MGKQFVSKKVEEERKEAQERRVKIDEDINATKKTKRGKRLSMMWILLIILIAGTAFGAYLHYKPGRYDSFAKCLTEKGVIMYGADWCQYTAAQRGMFGKSFKYITYKNYDARDDIKITPTWEVDGQLYERVLAFDRLAGLSVCTLN